MFAYKCIVAYEGTRYKGWQKQGNTQNTIQEKIETVLTKLIGESIEIAASGRTDAGVHATGQVFHFHTSKNLADCATTKTASYSEFLSAINTYLPKDIRILQMESCSLRFHARLHAKQKTYQYQIDTSPYGNPFLQHYAHAISTSLDISAMQQAACYLIGTHDFKSFTSNKRMKKSSVRTLYRITILPDDAKQLLTLTFVGDGFLYNMVRILTGTLIEVGLGLRSPDTIPSILEGCDRSLAGHTAPPQGLSLLSVSYDDADTKMKASNQTD